MGKDEKSKRKKQKDKRKKEEKKDKKRKKEKKEKKKLEQKLLKERELVEAEKLANEKKQKEEAAKNESEKKDMSDLAAALRDATLQIASLSLTLQQLVKQQQQRFILPRRAPLPPSPALKNKIPETKKVWIHARYKMHELSFHTEIWREMGLEVTQAPQCNDWTVRWSMRLQPSEWVDFQPWHKTNFIPGVHALIRKDNLHRSITAMQRRFGMEAFDFWPLSFNLPDEWKDFSLCAKSLLDAAWILKPPSSSCGRRIRVAPSFAEIGITPHDDWVQTHRPLVQRYLETPLLDGHKFTFRVYVVLTGLDPLRIYVYGDGLTRIASRKYSSEKDSFDDPFVHLDSIDVNDKNAEAVEFSIPTLETEGLRSTIMRTLDHFVITAGIDKDKVWREIETVIVKSVLCAEGDMLAGVRNLVRHRGSCFDLLGYDILLDKQFKPWIIEINHSPSMAPLTTMENRVKHAMLTDYFRLADVALEDRASLRELVGRFSQSVRRLSSDAAPYALADFAKMENEQKFDPARLSDRDIYTLVNRFLENSRKGGFECVFPCVDMLERFGPFYKKNRNVLHQVWIKERRTLEAFLK